MTHSIVYENLTAGPDWVTLDTSSETITVSPPSDSSSQYNLGVYSTFSGGSSFRSFQLVISPGGNISKELQDLETSATVIVFVGFSLILVSSFSLRTASYSSMQQLWMAIESMQFMILIPLIGAFVPPIIKDFLTQFNFLLFTFRFITAPFRSQYEWLEDKMS